MNSSQAIVFRAYANDGISAVTVCVPTLKILRIVCVLAMASIFASEALGGGVFMQSPESFEAAIRNLSTSPSYVLVTVVDARTESAQSICTSAPFLVGAIHLEYGLGYDEAGQMKAYEIALSNQAHEFHFSNQEALNNIPVRYSASDLASARAVFASLSTAELKSEFESLFERKVLAPRGLPREAIACVLIERGLSPQMADRTGQVFVEPLRNHP